MASLTSAQVNQSRMLLRALHKAKDKLTDSLKNPHSFDSSIIQQRKFAIDALVQARLRIEQSQKNVCDVDLKHLLLHLDRLETSRVKNVLETFLPKKATLLSFGHVPWSEVEARFTAAETRCPLALLKFHAEFQEELHVGANLSDIVSNPQKNASRP